MTHDNLDNERKRILYRANHRGIKEMDIVLGGFAQRHIAGFSDSELKDFNAFLEEHDRDLILWVTGETALPDHLNQTLFERIVSDIKNPEL